MIEAYVHITWKKDPSELLEKLRSYREINRAVTVIGGYADGLLVNMLAGDKRAIEEKVHEIKRLPYVKDVRLWWVIEQIT